MSKEHDNTFVRKDFYVQPPTRDASPDEWHRWEKEDRRAAIADKRAFAKAHQQAELPELADGTYMRKVGGIWKQSTAIGYAGSIEDGSGHLEPVAAENQERDYIRARLVGFDRGVSHVRSGSTKRKARRQRRKAQKYNQ